MKKLMNLNKDILDFKDPELRKKVDKIHLEREMISTSILIFIEKVLKKLRLIKELRNFM